MEIISAIEVGKKIGLKNIHAAMAFVPNDMKLLLPSKDKIGRRCLVVYLTKDGVRCLLCKSRKQNVVSVAKYYGIDLREVYKKSIERSTLDTIKTIFSCETMLEQYSVSNGENRYLIDLYFPEYRIAVECDENRHERSTIKDINRQENIVKVLDHISSDINLRKMISILM